MLSLTAKDIMTRDVITIRPGASMEEALRLMACNNVSGLPVVDANGELVGIITESDVLLKGQYLPPERNASPVGLFSLTTDGMSEAHRRAQSVLVEDAMNRKVLVFDEDSPVTDIARAMIEFAINRVPILNGKKVVGIVSRKDVVMAMAKEANGYDVCDSHKKRSGQMIEL